MNRSDVNRIFTEQVNALLAQGYQINLDTMRGSQGEIGKVDLRKDDDILRVVLREESDCWNSYNGHFVITIGRSHDPRRRGWDNIIWDHELEILSQIKLAKVTDDYFVTPEEGVAFRNLSRERYHRKPEIKRRVELGEAFKSPALRWLRKQPRMKSCKLEDIESVARLNGSEWACTSPKLYAYEIKARGKVFTLKAPRKDR